MEVAVGNPITVLEFQGLVQELPALELLRSGGGGVDAGHFCKAALETTKQSNFYSTQSSGIGGYATEYNEATVPRKPQQQFRISPP